MIKSSSLCIRSRKKNGCGSGGVGLVCSGGGRQDRPQVCGSDALKYVESSEVLLWEWLSPGMEGGREGVGLEGGREGGDNPGRECILRAVITQVGAPTRPT